MNPSSRLAGTSRTGAACKACGGAAPGRRMKRTSPACGTASTTVPSSSSRACSERAGRPGGGVATKLRCSACARRAAGVPAASTRPWRSRNTCAQRSASSR